MRKPRLTAQVPPILTRYAISKLLQGTIIARCVVTQSGLLEDCCIVKGVDGLNASVINAVRKWKYEPATQGGMPVKVDYVINVRIAQGR